MTFRPNFNPIRFALLRLMTLTPAPVSTGKLSGAFDCGTLTFIHNNPSRNSKGNSEAGAACTPVRAAAKNKTAHRQQRTARSLQIGCQTGRWTEIQARDHAFKDFFRTLNDRRRLRSVHSPTLCVKVAISPVNLFSHVRKATAFPR